MIEVVIYGHPGQPRGQPRRELLPADKHPLCLFVRELKPLSMDVITGLDEATTDVVDHQFRLLGVDGDGVGYYGIK